MFDHLKKDDSIKGEEDRLGGGGVLDTNLYNFTIDKAYISKSTAGAMALNVDLVTDDKRNLRNTIYFTSGTAKGGLNTYKDASGKDAYLPGFITVDSLCLLACGKSITQLVPEEKIVKIYDFDAKKELPTKVPVLMELIGKRITAGVEKHIVDKTKDTGTTDANGKKIYAPTGETREINEIAKFFRERDGMTVPEVLAKADVAQFKDQWLEKNAGVVKDKTKKTDGKPAAAKTATGAPAPTAAAPVKSLFED